MSLGVAGLVACQRLPDRLPLTDPWVVELGEESCAYEEEGCNEAGCWWSSLVGTVTRDEGRCGDGCTISVDAGRACRRVMRRTEACGEEGVWPHKDLCFGTIICEPGLEDCFSSLFEDGFLSVPAGY